MARVHVPPDELDATIVFYEQLLNEACEVRFPIAELGIEVAAVGGIHIVAGSTEALAPFAAVRAAFFVDSVVEFRRALERAESEILQEPRQGPLGMFMIARHHDGLVVEYADQAEPAPEGRIETDAGRT